MNRKSAARVLILEQDTAPALEMMRALEGLGYRVVARVTDGEEAVRRALAERPDVVLADVVADGAIDGIEAATRIRAQSDIPVVYVTAHVDDELVERAKMAEPYGYIVKPFIDRELYSNIEMALYKSGMERKLRAAVTELQDSEARLVEAQRIAHVGSFEWDIDSGRVSWSDELFNIYGQTPTFTPSYRHYLELIPAPDRERVREVVTEALAGAHGYDVEHRILRPDKTVRHVRSRAKVLLDEAGKPRRMIGTCQDVSAQRQAEERMRQSAAVFDNTIEAVAITDAKRRIIAVNRAFSEITGYDETEVMGKSMEFLNSGRHDARFYQQIWSKVDADGRWQGEVWNRRRGGEVYPEWATVTAVQDENGDIANYIVVSTDISLIKQSEKQLDHLAHHDPLTDLPNRLLFDARLNHALHRASREHRALAVLFIDLDRFKGINDTLGHQVGDRMLRQVAKRLTGCLREEDTVARLGGDEFVVLAEGLDMPRYAAEVAQKILERLAKPYRLDGRELLISGSIGISLFPVDGTDVDSLMKHADAAMYRAKQRGKNNFQFYTAEMTSTSVERFNLENRLRRALNAGEFELYYQPRVAVADGTLVGVEALIRWHHPEYGLMLPHQFLAVAEEAGLMRSIGHWVLHNACAQISGWIAQGQEPMTVAVNLSAAEFNDRLGSVVASALESSGLEPRYLELEISEEAVMRNPDQAVRVADALKALGVRLVVDNFGTGCSSLSYLKQLAPDKLKTDHSFVRTIIEGKDGEVAKAVISLGHTLNMRVAAEGVETAEQADFLRRNGCDEMQGFIVSPPRPAADVVVTLH